MLEKLENYIIRKYGFENWKTILIFKITNIVREYIKWISK